jgi:hypothetical protein
VKALEKKEKQWMAKLQQAQIVQESAFEYLEEALTKNDGTKPSLIMIL